jgi:hypothetical protein
LAEKDKQLARVLSQYKNSQSDEVRRKFTNELACVLAAFWPGISTVLTSSTS